MHEALQSRKWTVENRRIEVEVLWNNGEASWKHLAVLFKDDPVTLAGYAKERKFLNQMARNGLRVFYEKKRDFQEC
eukprot:4161948-Ditylum_brightwellii.AAC.1